MNTPFITGYTDKISVQPGGSIEFKISSTCKSSYEADLVRIVHGDPNPAGPGIKYVPVESSFQEEYASVHKEVHLGSYGITRAVANEELKRAGDDSIEGFTVGATIWPTLLAAPLSTSTEEGDGHSRRGESWHQSVLSRFDAAGTSGFSLGIGPGGTEVVLRSLGPEGQGIHRRISVGKSTREREWYRIHAIVDVTSGKVLVSQQCLRPEFGVDDCGEANDEMACHWEGILPGKTGEFFIAAAPSAIFEGGGVSVTRCADRIHHHFNGKVERPFVAAGALEGEKLHNAFHRGYPGNAPFLACWDFSIDQSTQIARDRGVHGLHATLINLPARGMKGSKWTGREMCWRHAPDEYGAIHFHDDDIYDCGWDTDFIFNVPHDMPSGVYGSRLQCREKPPEEDAEEVEALVEDIIPFYVRPKPSQPKSNAVFLASTFTHQIYANHVRGNADAKYFDRVRSWPGARQFHPDVYARYFGASTYNLHRDGSGICYSSRLRPILTMRPGFLTFATKESGSGLRHFPADTHLLDWLEAKGQNFDVVTDEDLDDGGADVLRPYRVVLTGSHPEYHTERTLDALESYADDGGRLMYLGGNGFYWKIARCCANAAPAALEIRRGEGGIRAWAAEPGEYYHSLDGGSYGGLWRRNGRPPQRLVGVGFSSQGLFEGAYYVRRPETRDDPRVSWIFEGIPEGEDTLGDFGLSGGGAAGFELDRADWRLGTPLNAVVLASSRGHSGQTFIPVYEEMLTHVSTTTGQPPEEFVRADMVYMETAGGGAVFSTGSITFCGSLSHNEYKNNISTITMNVLMRFRGEAHEGRE